MSAADREAAGDFSVTLDRDPDSRRPTSLDFASGSLARTATFGHHPVGNVPGNLPSHRPDTLGRGGLLTTHRYSPTGLHPTGRRHEAGGQTLADFEFALDRGRREGELRQWPGRSSVFRRLVHNRRDEIAETYSHDTAAGLATTTNAASWLGHVLGAGPVGGYLPDRARHWLHDDIGNRTRGVEGGAVTNDYAPNDLNQYDQVVRSDAAGSVAVVRTHDADGNLTGDGRFSYTWDGENRLVAAEALDGSITVSNRYDWLGRRVVKRTLTAAGTGTNTVFVYDGTMLVEERWEPVGLPGSHPLRLRRYVWGPDLSGTVGGAGGVGGLQSVVFTENGVSTVAHCLSDGMGNVVGLADEAGNLLDHYDHDVFGNPLNEPAHPLARANPFRFSTKYLDRETGLYDCGRRFYDPAHGSTAGPRWPICATT